MTQEKEWFRTWFDSPYYHLLYKHRGRDEASDFIRNLTDHLRLAKGSRILDLGCGKGRHALELHQLGFEVHGIDLSTASIQQAKPYERPGLSFSVADMRKPFGNNDYDGILNLFSSFGYFGDQTNEAVLRNVKTALAPGGLFVLDYMNPKKQLKDLIPEETLHIEGVKFHINRFEQDGYIIKTIGVKDGEATHHFEEKLRLFEEKDLVNMLEEQGMRVKEIKGDYQMGGMDPERSDRLIPIAEKKG